MASVLDPEGAHLAALRRLATFDGMRVLEVGCGDGRLTLPLGQQAAAILAFDPDATAVETARARLPSALADRVTFRVASAEAIDVPPSAFDIVLFSWSL